MILGVFDKSQEFVADVGEVVAMRIDDRRGKGTVIPTGCGLVGYSTPFSFTKAFVRELGVPPSVQRDQQPTA